MGLLDPPTPAEQAWLDANRRPEPVSDAQIEAAAALLRSGRARRPQTAAAPKDAA